VPSSAPSAPHQDDNLNAPDGFPGNCSNFTFDYILYDRKNAPATSFIWDGFDALKPSLPDNISTAHARVANFIAMSREKVNGMDSLIKEFQSIRTGVNRNIALAVQRQKTVEASPAWLNRFTAAEPSVKEKSHSELTTGLAALIKCLDNLTRTQVESLQFLSGDALVHLRSSLSTMAGEQSPMGPAHVEVVASPTTTPPPKKGRVRFDEAELDPYADICASGLFDEEMPSVSDSPIEERTSPITAVTSSGSTAGPSVPALPPQVPSSLSKSQLKKIKKKKKGGR